MQHIQKYMYSPRWDCVLFTISLNIMFNAFFWSWIYCVSYQKNMLQILSGCNQQMELHFIGPTVSLQINFRAAITRGLAVFFCLTLAFDLLGSFGHIADKNHSRTLLANARSKFKNQKSFRFPWMLKTLTVTVTCMHYAGFSYQLH